MPLTWVEFHTIRWAINSINTSDHLPQIANHWNSLKQFSSMVCRWIRSICPDIWLPWQYVIMSKWSKQTHTIRATSINRMATKILWRWTHCVKSYFNLCTVRVLHTPVHRTAPCVQEIVHLIYLLEEIISKKCLPHKAAPNVLSIWVTLRRRLYLKSRDRKSSNYWDLTNLLPSPWSVNTS